MSDKSLSNTALMRSLSSAGRPSSSIASACLARMAVRTVWHRLKIQHTHVHTHIHTPQDDLVRDSTNDYIEEPLL